MKNSIRGLCVLFFILLVTLQVADAKSSICQAEGGYNNGSGAIGVIATWATAGDCCTPTSGVAMVERATFMYSNGSWYLVSIQTYYLPISTLQDAAGCNNGMA
jgi:hypothetical protein